MEIEPITENISGADNIYSQSVNNPRDVYFYRNIAELADIQLANLLQYNRSRLYNIDTARSVAV